MNATVIWDDQPGGNVDHIALNGLTPDEVDEVDEVLLDNFIPVGRTRTTGRPCKFGWTTGGKYIIVVWDVVNDDPLIIVPVTAFEVPPG